MTWPQKVQEAGETMKDGPMTDRSGLVAAIQAAHKAQDGRALAQAVAALDAHDSGRAARTAADRELDLGAQVVASRLAPVPVHELHTAATDWIADFEVPGDGSYRTAMIAEASTWWNHLDAAVKADPGELAEQARGRAGTIASAHGAKAPAAAREFLSVVGYLAQREGASGLPQIDQLIDPNNQPGATPYPTEVFPTFGEEQDEFNGVETNAHGSGAASSGAPMLQQLQQQQGGGSGFGSGPEKPDEHSTGFDTSNSYAEVPLGAPGVIPTSPAPTDQSAGSSHPNPVAGTNQVADTDQPPGDEDRHRMASYSGPDAFGYRWLMVPGEVMHPFHERCGSAHWPDQGCEDRAHTASVAIGYAMNLDQAHKLASCERIGAGEGLRAFHGSRTLADLTVAHNRFATAWGSSDRTAEDTAVLHGFMAVVRPVMAEMLPNHAGRGDGIQAAGGLGTSEPRDKVARYIGQLAREYGAAPAGASGKPASAGSRLDFPLGGA